MGNLKTIALFLILSSVSDTVFAKSSPDSSKEEKDTIKSPQPDGIIENVTQSLFFLLSAQDSAPQKLQDTSSEETPDNKTDTNSALGNLGMLNKKLQSQSQNATPSDSTLDIAQHETAAIVPNNPALDTKTVPGTLTTPPLEDHTFEENHPSKIEHPLPQHHEIVAHKAHYTITLEKNFGDDVSDVAGEMTITTFDTGDGFVYEQNSSLLTYRPDGEKNEQIIINLATWQDYDGNTYRFQAKTLCNGEQEEIIKGEAIKDPLTKTAKVIYQLPEAHEISIPYDSIFPFHHLLNALAEAKTGKGGVENTVFDGASETYEAVYVDTLLGAPQKSLLTIKTGNPDLDTSIKTQWPMRLSVSAVGSKNSAPDYDMIQNVLDSGVIKDMTLNYVTFQIKATLDKIIFYDGKGADGASMGESEGVVVERDA